MNCYFVFEGKTEPEIYKAWLKILVEDLQEVDFLPQVTDNNYIYYDNTGYPNCYNIICNAIQDIHESAVIFDYLVVFLDTDQVSIEERQEELQKEVQQKLASREVDYKGLPESCELIIITQKVCIETWFLGNRKFFPTANQSPELTRYRQYFDVCANDPEELAQEFIAERGSNLFGCSTRALFHAKYLNAVFKDRTRNSRIEGYGKAAPKEVIEPYYLQQLIKRTQETGHLSTFQTFLDFCQTLNPNLKF
ncbi:MAG: hypothetical protein ACRBFS_24915 [Aureispira sp.]